MLALEEIRGSYVWALDSLEEVFEIKWKVYPITLQKTRILARLNNWEYVIWEKNIDIPKYDDSLRVEDIYVLKESYAKALS